MSKSSRNFRHWKASPSITEPHALKMKPVSISIKASGLGHSRFCRTFFDIKIFNPYATSCPRNIKGAYKQHESEKTLNMNRIDVEHSIFNPLVFACTGGAGPSSSKVMSRLALKISEKGYDSYSDAISFIRTKISFALLWSSVLCLRRCRAIKRQIDHVESSIAATVQEGMLSWIMIISSGCISWTSVYWPFY